MNTEVEILLVEDNPNDAELAMRALQKNNLAITYTEYAMGRRLSILFLPVGSLKSEKSKIFRK